VWISWEASSNSLEVGNRFSILLKAEGNWDNLCQNSQW